MNLNKLLQKLFTDQNPNLDLNVGKRINPINFIKKNQIELVLNEFSISAYPTLIISIGLCTAVLALLGQNHRRTMIVVAAICAWCVFIYVLLFESTVTFTPSGFATVQSLSIGDTEWQLRECASGCRAGTLLVKVRCLVGPFCTARQVFYEEGLSRYSISPSERRTVRLVDLEGRLVKEFSVVY